MAWKQIVKFVTLGILFAMAAPAVALAYQSASTNYQVEEVFFGSGGALNDCSSNYCAKEAIGEVAVGNTASTNYQAQGGFNTDRTPYIQFTVSNSNINLGTLSASTTATTTATFSVKAYLSSGYVVINASPPPTNGSYTMNTLTTPTASSTGVEQFGINLTANTTPTAPANFGANPVQEPDSTFGFGQVEAPYDSNGLFLYNQGDPIAYSNSSTSYTIYTISYVFNISHVTPGGTYTFNHVLVATATY
jgi:hypothetical protein